MNRLRPCGSERKLRMSIIAIDSSGLVASVAIACEGGILAEYTVNNKKTHSQTLLPMLDEIKRITETDLKDVEAVAVAAGPGSFTGLRIGSATVKGIAQALQVPVVEVSTLDALAWNLYGCASLVCPIMDARRGQVYTGLYEYAAEETSYSLRVVKEPCAVLIDEIAEEINRLDREVIFLGDGVPVFEKHLAEIMKVPYCFAPIHLARQRAACVAELGIRKLKAGETVPAGEHSPEYLRLSQAERERMEAEKNA